eukprot:g46287.t1
MASGHANVSPSQNINTMRFEEGFRHNFAGSLWSCRNCSVTWIGQFASPECTGRKANGWTFARDEREIRRRLYGKAFPYGNPFRK